MFSMFCKTKPKPKKKKKPYRNQRAPINERRLRSAW
jgi:hypothetical protein